MRGQIGNGKKPQFIREPVPVLVEPLKEFLDRVKR
jgi:hypothetical protein